MTAKFISLLKPNKENAHSIGRTVLKSIKITDDRSIIDTLLALSWVARSLNETLKAVWEDRIKVTCNINESDSFAYFNNYN